MAKKAAIGFLDNRLRELYKEWKKFIRTIYKPSLRLLNFDAAEDGEEE